MGTMSVKTGTKAFGAPSEKPVSSNANPSNISATDKERLGADNMGDVLNKIVDQNYVDPSKKMRTVGNDKLDKDAFFKLMLAQMILFMIHYRTNIKIEVTPLARRKRVLLLIFLMTHIL